MDTLFDFAAMQQKALNRPIMEEAMEDAHPDRVDCCEAVDLGPFLLSCTVLFALDDGAQEGHWLVSFAVFVEERGDQPLSPYEWPGQLRLLALTLTNIAVANVGDPLIPGCMHVRDTGTAAYRQATAEECAKAVQALAH